MILSIYVAEPKRWSNITFVSAAWGNMCKLEGGMYDKLHIDRYGGHLIVPVSK